MTLWLWLAVAFTLAAMIVVELLVLTRRAREVPAAEALVRAAMWVVLSAAIGVSIFYVYQAQHLRTKPSQPPTQSDILPDLEPGALVPFVHDIVGPPASAAPLDGRHALLQYATAYVIELALAADNIAVLALLIACFRLPRPLVARALFWAVMVSLVVRLGLVLGGAQLLRKADWVHYAFGALLIIAMLRMLLMPDESTDFERSRLVRTIRALLPIAPTPDQQRLTTRWEGKRAFTPLAVVALAAAIADITFALDSVPAVFSVTRDPLIAFSASAMALLALRSLYFALEPVIGRFRYLKITLVFVLLWVAAKSFVLQERGVPTLVTLAIVTVTMTAGITASILYHRFHPPETPAPTARPIDDLAALATWRNIRKAAVLIVGAVIIVVGVAIIGPLPGPGGIPVVAAGLGLLATEFVWAQRLLKQFKEKTVELQKQTDRMAERSNPWMVPLVVAGYWGAFWLVTFLLGHWGFHKTARFLWLASIGTFIPVGYWAFQTLRAAWKSRAKHEP